jgi:hypothetical protein
MRWELAIAAVAGFAIVWGCQTWVLNQFIEQVVKPVMRLRTTEEFSQLTRIDMAGVVKLLEIANGLLAAVLAVLVFK